MNRGKISLESCKLRRGKWNSRNEKHGNKDEECLLEERSFSRLNTAEDIKSKFEYRSVEITQTETQRLKKVNKT